MARISFLLRRGASYYARIKVPIDLVDLVGKKELVKALGTKEPNDAKRLMWPVVEAWNLHFADLRSRRDITTDDKAVAVWQHYEATLKRDEERRLALPSDIEINAERDDLYRRIDKGEINGDDFIGMINAYTDHELMLRARTDDANYRTRRLAALKRALTTGDIKLIEPAAAKFITDNRLIVAADSDDYRELCTLLTRAEVEGLTRTIERDKGDYTGLPKDPIVKPVIGSAREVAASGETIMELFAKYERQNPRSITADTFKQARRDIGTFLDCVGSTLPVHRIDKKAVRDWKELLMQYPVKASETSVFAGLKMSQIVAANEKERKPVLTPRTVNRYLSSLGAFCNWLVSEGYIDANPVDGMSLPKDKRKKVYPFNSDQMNLLFKSPLFTGCQSDEAPRFWDKPGNVMIRDHRFWVPLIMLFSGARPAEIAQLTLSDVREEFGHWIMDITETGDEGDDTHVKSVKTSGSQRIVPIHKELIKLGLLDYHASIKRRALRASSQWQSETRAGR